MSIVKIIPSAIVDIQLYNGNAELVATATTRNALKSNFVQTVGKNLFSQRFSLRLGASNAPSDYTDCELLAQKIPTTDWPVASNSTQWPQAVVKDGRIEWTTIQSFDVPPGLVVGAVNEFGFNFYGNDSEEIHARAILQTPLTLDESSFLKVTYTLTFSAPFAETTYNVTSYQNGNGTVHSVVQRWARRSTLWDIIGGQPTNQECRLYNGTLEGLDIEPTDPIGTSSHAYMSRPSAFSFSVTAIIDADNGNTLNGLRCLSWTTIPVKAEFTPPIPKSSESVMTATITWALDV